MQSTTHTPTTQTSAAPQVRTAPRTQQRPAPTRLSEPEFGAETGGDRVPPIADNIILGED
ncbi:hypothetical protein [Streptacidiphilus carbonis]|uniref:hypothetical protein n=1 Tax=Streptacidiphilus carbonis TaxID=105422 RepID=UPI0005A8F504|nr:hypothetical protein [Streptacidiphilus carbonis]